MSGEEIARELRRMRIGYVPLSNDFTAPGDRRRFSRWAASRNIPYEVAQPGRTYDFVVLSQRADTSVWKRHDRTKGKIVYDLIDSYLAVPSTDVKGALRGLAKYAVRQTKHLELSYRASIAEMCSRADAVVCSTEEQRRDISRYCHDVHIILDVQSGDAVVQKQDYRMRGAFNLVWEGLPENLAGFRDILPTLRELAARRPLALHLITDLSYHRYLNKISRTHTAGVIAKMGVPAYLYQWNSTMMATIAAACDLAIIPIRSDDVMAIGKPENKLLLFWRLAVPALTSRTPAYDRAMKAAHLDMTCADPDEWREKLEAYAADEALRARAGRAGLEVANGVYGEQEMLRRWDVVFASLLSRP